MNRVTIKDIAKELNLSISTVSRALKDHPALKNETIKRVKALANKLDYRPNLFALKLLEQKSNTIAIIIPEITSHFYSTAITAIWDVLASTDYSIIICLSNESYQEEVTIIERVINLQIDGVLICPSANTKNFDHLKKLQERGVPLVVFDRDCKDLEVDKVLVDDYNGAFQAVDYLIKSGCKNIAFIGGSSNLTITNHRLQGYLDALRNNNISILKKYIIHVSGFSHEDGINPTKKLLGLRKPPDAIFAMNDSIAISAMNVAKKLNYNIPKDISIIGFDDEPHSVYFTPSLSTVWQPVYSMGMLSARILLSHLSSNIYKIKTFRHEVFLPELVIRSSSKII